MSIPAYGVRADGGVWESRGAASMRLGRVSPFKTGSSPVGNGEYWLPLDNEGAPLSGPTKVRALAALTIIRIANPDADLLDILEDEPCA